MKTPPIQQKESAGQHDAHEGQEQEGKTLSPPAFQLMASDGADAPPAQLKPNSGGLPGDMLNGFAASTGHDLSDVKVHSNSDKPSQVGALAYAQGNEIHLGAGQEKHLAHEAAHIVQQREGRVKPTTEVNGKPVNDNAGLESEADSMGAKAMQMKAAAKAGQLKKGEGGPGAVQMIAYNVAITGITHLVKMELGSIYEGDEVAEVYEGDIIRIDTDTVFRSRRGPNQETYREEDRTGPQHYVWYKALSLNGANLPKNTFVRDDTFRELSKSERKSHLPKSVVGSKLNTDTKDYVTGSTNLYKAVTAYLKTGPGAYQEICGVLGQLGDQQQFLQLAQAAQSSSNESGSSGPSTELQEKAQELEIEMPKLIQHLQKEMAWLFSMNDGAHEPALFFLNLLNSAVGNLLQKMPVSAFVGVLKSKAGQAKKNFYASSKGKSKELGQLDFQADDVAAPEVGEHVKDLQSRYDMISRKTSASTRRSGAIHEVDLALVPQMKGIANVKASVDSAGKVTIEPGQAERAFAIGYLGALNFGGELSNQGGERYYATLFPKGWLDTFSQDVRTSSETGKSAREPGLEDFVNGAFKDGNVTIQIQQGMAFLVRAEDSTADEGQITVHMDRNQLLFGGKSMIDFIRDAVTGVVEFNEEGNVIYFNTF